MAKEIIKTADASFAAKQRDPNLLIVRALYPVASAFIEGGIEIKFKSNLATITRDQAEYFSDTARFAFDVPHELGPVPVLPHSDPPDPTRAADGTKE